MPKTLLYMHHGEWFAQLASGGWNGNPACNKFIAAFLADVRPLRRIRCVDMPEIMKSTLMLGVMASLAQQERELISQRTKEALAAKKAQGVKFGRPKGSDVSNAVKASIEKRMNDAQAWAEAQGKAIIRMAKSMNTNQIAATLNEQGLTTRRGGKWTATSVKRILARCGK